MKKNAMMKIAAILMVAVLLTTCAISSTFAKYVTSSESADAARVAKFGVTVTTNITSLFADKYIDDEVAGIKVVKDDDGQEKTVIDDVVAPGTTNGLTAAAKITGTPEVAVDVSVVATVDLGDYWVCDKDGTYYCPLAFTVNGTTIYGVNFKDAAAFAAEIKKLIEGSTSKQYAPNTNFNEELTPVDISWAWVFEADDITATDEAAQAAKLLISDVKDTYLGDQAAAGKAGTISITIKQSVTQLDEYKA